jgi:small subunit ribosomal protein S20
MAQDKAKAAKQKERRPTAQKRDIQAEKSRLRNKSFKASVKTAIRHFEDAIEAGDAEATKQRLNDVYSMMDKGAQRGVFKLNKASRTKARMTARLIVKQA